jgi:hypothetical protein
MKLISPYSKLRKQKFSCTETRTFKFHSFISENPTLLVLHFLEYLMNILIYIQQHATLHSLFYLEISLHVSGGTSTHHQERKQLSTASTAACRYSGR